MNKEKIMEMAKKVLKTRTGVGILVGIIAFGIGSSSSGSIQAELDKSTKDIAVLNEELDKSKEVNKELENKVAEAKPWFDMAENERKAEADRIAKAESDRLAKVKADKEEADKVAKAKQEEADRVAKAEAEAKKQADLEAKTKTLSNGNYTAGVDFDGGTYDLIAVNGGGNVSSSNLYKGGINAIMGVADDGF